MAEPETATLTVASLPSSDDLERATSFTREPFLLEGEDAATALAPGTPRRRALDSVSTIRAYRQKAEELRDQELQKALRALEAGTPAEQVLNQLARGLTNKLLHAPTTRLKKAGATGETHLLDFTHELFDLSPDDGEQKEL